MFTNQKNTVVYFLNVFYGRMCTAIKKYFLDIFMLKSARIKKDL